MSGFTTCSDLARSRGIGPRAKAEEVAVDAVVREVVLAEVVLAEVAADAEVVAR